MRLSDWNGFDWLLIAILLISMGVAYRRGIVRTICGLAGFFGGLMLATTYYTQLADRIVHVRLLASVPTARILSYLLIVIVTVIVSFGRLSRDAGGCRRAAQNGGLRWRSGAKRGRCRSQNRR